MDGVGGRGTNAVEMRNEPSTNGGVSKVSFHHTEFALGAIFPFIKLNLLAFYRLEFALVRLISVDISNNTGILEIDDGIVDEKSGSGGGMKDVEIMIFDPRAIEIGSGMCTCVEGNGELRVATLASSYEVSINSNLPEGDVACHFILPVLIEEDKWVLPCITAVVLTPPTSWMVQIIKLVCVLGNVGDRTRCGGEGNGGVILSEPDWFVVF